MTGDAPLVSVIDDGGGGGAVMTRRGCAGEVADPPPCAPRPSEAEVRPEPDAAEGDEEGEAEGLAPSILGTGLADNPAGIRSVDERAGGTDAVGVPEDAAPEDALEEGVAETPVEVGAEAATRGDAGVALADVEGTSVVEPALEASVRATGDDDDASGVKIDPACFASVPRDDVASLACAET